MRAAPPIRIVPAVLAETWEDFAVRIRQAEVFADYVQVDMMDGAFVPSRSFAPEMLARLETRLSFEAHLMVADPLDWLAHQRRTPALLPRAFPSVSDLPGGAEAAGYFRSRIIFGEQFARLFAALFHRGMVSCLQHAKTIQDIPINVTLLCETQ